MRSENQVMECNNDGTWAPPEVDASGSLSVGSVKGTAVIKVILIGRDSGKGWPQTRNIEKMPILGTKIVSDYQSGRAGNPHSNGAGQVGYQHYLAELKILDEMETTTLFGFWQKFTSIENNLGRLSILVQTALAGLFLAAFIFVFLQKIEEQGPWIVKNWIHFVPFIISIVLLYIAVVLRFNFNNRTDLIKYSGELAVGTSILVFVLFTNESHATYANIYVPQVINVIGIILLATYRERRWLWNSTLINASRPLNLITVLKAIGIYLMWLLALLFILVFVDTANKNSYAPISFLPDLTIFILFFVPSFMVTRYFTTVSFLARVSIILPNNGSSAKNLFEQHKLKTFAKRK